MKNKSIIKSASKLGLASFLVKILGALFRIPLTNLIGGLGIGLYQMIFPVYSLLLDFSGCALPSALSKLIASDNEEKRFNFLSVSLKAFFFIGLITSLFLLIFSYPIAKLQGNENAYLGYLTLSPAILTVSLISCFRGYFQGQLEMSPTAISQIIEQGIKLVLGLLLAKLFLPNIPLAVAGATLSISISEVIALIYLFFVYKKKKGLPLSKLLKYKFDKVGLKAILKTVIPITFMGIILPFSQVIDSFLTINIIGKYRQDATTLFGLLGGVALTIVNLPVSIVHGISVVAIPSISKSKDRVERDKNAYKVLFFTLVFVIPCAILCYIFSPLIISILFKSLVGEEKSIAINLIRLLSPSIITLSLLQTLNGVLIGQGKLYSPIFSLLISVIVKIILNVLLLQNPQVNIYAGGIALNACYFLACLINLNLVKFNKKVKNANARTQYRENFS